MTERDAARECAGAPALPEVGRRPALEPGGAVRVRRVRWALAAAGTALLVYYLVRFLEKGFEPEGIDLDSYFRAARALMGGQSPYVREEYPYLYPPLCAFLVIPFTLIPRTAALLAWFAVSLGSFAYSVRRTRDWATGGRPVQSPLSGLVPLALLVVLLFPALTFNFTNGQINVILAGMIVLFAQAYLCGRRRLASVVLAVAISIKILPAVLGLFLLIRRDLVSLAWTAVVCLLCFLVPALVFGLEPLSLLSDYADQLRWAADRAAGPSGIDFTLHGQLAKWLPVDPGSRLLLGSSAAVVTLCLAFADTSLRRASGPESPARNRVDAYAVAMYAAAVLLLSPMSQKHHLALLLPGLSLTLFAAAERDRPWGRALRASLAVFVAAYVLTMVFPYGPAYSVCIASTCVAVWFAGRGVGGPSVEELGAASGNSAVA